MDKAVIKAKKIECIIGLILLLPSIIGVFAFVYQSFYTNGHVHLPSLENLSPHWTYFYNYDIDVYHSKYEANGGGMSAAPIYLGLMAIAGVYLIKDSFYVFSSKINKKL